MHGLFDTNILIDMTLKRQMALDLVPRYTMRYISAMTWSEFMVGLVDVPQDRENAARILQKLYYVVHTDLEICDLAADLRHRYRLKLPDAIIYATARTLGVPLVTRNTKDFDETMPGVHIPYIE